MTSHSTTNRLSTGSFASTFRICFVRYGDTGQPTQPLMPQNQKHFYATVHQGRFYVGQGTLAPRFICCPLQIQKLADRSNVISEVPKCSKIQISRGAAPDPAGGAYSAPPDLLTNGKGARCPNQEPNPRSRPFGPRFYGSQGLTGPLQSWQPY